MFICRISTNTYMPPIVIVAQVRSGNAGTVSVAALAERM